MPDEEIELITDEDLKALESDHRNGVSWGFDTERRLVVSLRAALAREKAAIPVDLEEAEKRFAAIRAERDTLRAALESMEKQRRLLWRVCGSPLGRP